MKYYECPHCGAHLDFGERCECEEIKMIWRQPAAKAKTEAEGKEKEDVFIRNRG